MGPRGLAQHNVHARDFDWAFGSATPAARGASGCKSTTPKGEDPEGNEGQLREHEAFAAAGSSNGNWPLATKRSPQVHRQSSHVPRGARRLTGAQAVQDVCRWHPKLNRQRA